MSKALMALLAVELELFTKLSGDKQMTMNKLRKVLGMEAHPTSVFASVLASLGLLQVTKKKKKTVKAYSQILAYLKCLWISQRILHGRYHYHVRQASLQGMR
jgi:hypothetical protein